MYLPLVATGGVAAFAARNNLSWVFSLRSPVLSQRYIMAEQHATSSSLESLMDCKSSSEKPRATPKLNHLSAIFSTQAGIASLLIDDTSPSKNKICKLSCNCVQSVDY